MILNSKIKKPKITFGLGKTELTVQNGTIVKVFQINNVAYDVLIDDTNLFIVNKINNNEFEIETIDTGEVFIKPIADTRYKIDSNKIKLTII